MKLKQIVCDSRAYRETDSDGAFIVDWPLDSAAFKFAVSSLLAEATMA